MSTFTFDAARLNSATKYPSIPTYHALGDRGVLQEEVTEYSGDVVLTEKVDGTNGRIVLLPRGDYAIGAREGLLYAKGDRIMNPALGIVSALKPLADELSDRFPVKSGAVSLYLEVYGSEIGRAAKQYQSGGGVGYRLFDVAQVPSEVLALDPLAISAWREDGGQAWLDEAALQACADTHHIPLVPRLATLRSEDLPRTVEGAHAWLTRTLPTTLVALDDGAQGAPEGIVLRDTTRGVISKARVENYERTLKHRAGGKR